MASNSSFTLLSVFYAFLLVIIFFSKKRLKSIPNKIYSVIVITTAIGVTISLGTFYFMLNMADYPLLNYFFARLYLVFLLVINTLMTYYTTYLCVTARYKQITASKILKITKYTLIIASAIAFTLFFSLPIYYNSDYGSVYSYGPGVNVMYWYSRCCCTIWFILIVRNCKKLSPKQYIPMIAFITLGFISTVIQSINPTYLLTTATVVFVTFLMYFTIENPDMQMIEQLNIARDAADKANKAKTDFLSSMSHEIRTPLNAIVGFSQALLEEDINESAKDEVKDIMMASDNLLEIVNGILDISKIEANKLEIVNTEYNFKKIFNELVTLSKARLGEKPLEFKTYFDESIPDVMYGDYSRIKQIVLNLLTNAIKYTKTGYIDFRVNSIKKDNVCRLIISVEDSGIGIKKENIEKLFNKFQRLDLEQNITIEGTGLGLAITKKLVELMNGKIVVQSEYGTGSKFTVAIDQQIVNKTLTDIEPVEIITPTENLVLTGKRVVVVDDNKVNLKVAARLLKNYELEITEFDNGFDCIENIKAGNKYDLILMDDMMPKMSGVETFQKLTEIPDFNIPTVALTANAISGMKEKYLKDGFNDYLSKPISKEELDRVIKEFLNKN